jgi:hypothetical protein
MFNAGKGYLPRLLQSEAISVTVDLDKGISETLNFPRIRLFGT